MRRLVFFVFIACALLSSSMLHESSAKKSPFIQYGTLPNKFAGTPTFCTKEPAYDPSVPESLIPILMKKAKSSVDAWVGPLKSSGKRDAKWDVNYVTVPRNKQNTFDYAKCDVVISFSKKPPVHQSPGELLGTHHTKNGKSYIEIYYQGYGVCETRDDIWVYWYTCEQDSPKLIVMLEAIMRHEIGHAMGLDHYISEETTYLWIDISPPSVMVPVIDILASPTSVPMDPDNLQIMPVDILKLKEIYGDNGWGNQQKTEKKLQTKPSTLKTINLKHGKTVVEKISGSIPIEMYKKGRIDVTITKPDGTKEVQKIGISNNGKFEHTFYVTDATPPGKYELVISYFGNEIKRITYQVK